MENVLQKKMEKEISGTSRRKDQELFQSSAFIKYNIWKFSVHFFFYLCILSMKTGCVMTEVPLSA